MFMNAIASITISKKRFALHVMCVSLIIANKLLIDRAIDKR